MATLGLEILGWSGVVLLIVAYALLTADKVKSQSKIYQGVNIVGSVFITINAFSNHAYPSVAGNALWLIIAVWGFTRIKLKK